MAEFCRRGCCAWCFRDLLAGAKNVVSGESDRARGRNSGGRLDGIRISRGRSSLLSFAPGHRHLSGIQPLVHASHLSRILSAGRKHFRLPVPWRGVFRDNRRSAGWAATQAAAGSDPRTPRQRNSGHRLPAAPATLTYNDEQLRRRKDRRNSISLSDGSLLSRDGYRPRIGYESWAAGSG